MAELKQPDGIAEEAEATSNRAIAERIKQVRKALGMNQTEFARTLDITNAYISKLENDGNRASKLLKRTICTEYGINREWLETGEGKMFAGHAVKKGDAPENQEKAFLHYVDAYPYITKSVDADIKSRGKDLMKALEILDLISGQEGIVRVKTALAILDDAKTILMETVTF